MKPMLVAAALMALACGGSSSEPNIWPDSLEISVQSVYEGDVSLVWTRFPGTYVLDRQIVLLGGAYLQLYSGTDTSYVDQSCETGTVYRFRVRAFDADWNVTASDSVDVQVFS